MSNNNNNTKTVSVLFVCLGNICRSPMAEGCFLHVIDSKSKTNNSQRIQWVVDSCNTSGYHVGEPPHRLTQKVLKKNGVKLSSRARMLCDEDFSKFDYVLGMDQSNMEDIDDAAPWARRGRGGSRKKRGGVLDKDTDASSGRPFIGLFGDFDDESERAKTNIIEDPYGCGEQEFDKVFDQCRRCAENLYNHIVRDLE
eukprot:Nk52_evm1s1680 gene=Nk52_evmTU1s1680